MQLVIQTVLFDVKSFTFPHTRAPHKVCIWMLPRCLGIALRREQPQLVVFLLRRFGPRTDTSRPQSHRQEKNGWPFRVSSKRTTVSMPYLRPVSSLNRRVD